MWAWQSPSDTFSRRCLLSQPLSYIFNLSLQSGAFPQIYDITAKIDSWLTDSLPDMILLMIGTNDLLSGEYQNQHDELHNLISRILSHSPDVELLVASIPPMSGSLGSHNELVENYNRYIPSIVNSYAQEGYFVYFADVYLGLDPNTDFYDDLHLNAQGYEKIADVWYDVIIQLLTGNRQPSVVITYPQDRSNFPENADILISTDAIDTDGFIDSVLFYADGARIGESHSPPHEIWWQSVPKGRYNLMAVATDNEGFNAYSAPVWITVGELPPDIRFVVGDKNLNAGDQALKARLELMGYNVYLRDDDVVSPSDADGMDLVLVSSTVSSGKVALTFRDVAVGVIVWEGYLFDDMDFAGPTGGDDYGFDHDQVQVEILEDTHPIASGLTGVVTVVDDGEGFFTWGRPNSNAARIAGFASDPSKAAVFAYDQGAIMHDGFAAPHCRVGMFLGDYTASHFTSQGWQLFDNAVLWALAVSGSPVNQAPVVDAGEDQTVASALPASTTLAGSVTDDGLPQVGELTFEWSSTDPEVTIVDPYSLTTQVAFSSHGIYSLTLTGFDGELIESDSVTITISDQLQPPSNLTYSNNLAIYTVGVAIPQNNPSSDGSQVESYSIDPALPSGLSLDSLTGIISGTPDEISAASTHTVTASNSAGETTAELTITIEDQSKEVLLVVRDLALIRGDQAVKNHLEAQGYIVSVTTNASALPSDALGKDLVVVTSTGSSAELGSTFRDVAVGVIVWEGYIFDDMDFTGPTGGDDYGFNYDQVQVEILEDTHPIASGLTGVVTVVDDGEGFFIWARPNSNAAHIAGFASDPSKVAVFAYDQGAVMHDGFAAPHRRVGMFLGDYTASHFTSQGWQLFDNAVLWALENF